MEHLDITECRQLLAGVAVGRLGYTAATGPRILPMNFVLVRDALFMRTIPDCEVARWALGDEVCFEVDHVDDFLRAGWGVLVTGRLEEPSSDLIRSLDMGGMPLPWPSGLRSLLMALPLTRVTGRRVHPS
jgi:nitroimidazol reductase NimA-like FMN-containing flavoprotein (pyridoxamine 5'-phosphate oxidase superfamily)